MDPPLLASWRRSLCVSGSMDWIGSAERRQRRRLRSRERVARAQPGEIADDDVLIVGEHGLLPEESVDAHALAERGLEAVFVALERPDLERLERAAEIEHQVVGLVADLQLRAPEPHREDAASRCDQRTDASPGGHGHPAAGQETLERDGRLRVSTLDEDVARAKVVAADVGV